MKRGIGLIGREIIEEKADASGKLKILAFAA
jgi:hypothetical protein